MTVLPLFTSKNGELLTRGPACLSHLPVWLAGRERTRMLKEEAGWDLHFKTWGKKNAIMLFTVA
uniref:Uncharacterized protein n=1 Tax=Catagonus wagneri TaxID=51154 RepID=A0A8C3WLM6_9CETA